MFYETLNVQSISTLKSIFCDLQRFRYFTMISTGHYIDAFKDSIGGSDLIVFVQNFYLLKPFQSDLDVALLEAQESRL